MYVCSSETLYRRCDDEDIGSSKKSCTALGSATRNAVWLMIMDKNGMSKLSNLFYSSPASTSFCPNKYFCILNYRGSDISFALVTRARK